jgi:hypothetical protein
MSLTEIYNRRINTVTWYRRQGNWSGLEGKGFHDGLMITDSTGAKWLLHITTGCAKAVLVDATAMSQKWHTSDHNTSPEKSTTIGQIMSHAEARGPYSYATNNCVQLVYSCLEKLGLIPDVSSD